jgi:predicted nucleic acid-binding protein
VIRLVVLDSGPLGLVTQRQGVAPADAYREWVTERVRRGARVVVPSIADYEVRRELERASKRLGLARLDAFNAAEADRFVPLTHAALRLASRLWAQSRNAGTPTADPHELDCDVLIAAQALSLGVPASELVVATTNVGHFAQFLVADLWINIGV